MRLSRCWPLALCALALLTGDAIAGIPRIAEVAVDAQGLTLAPSSDFERAVLEVVRPDGQKVRERFDAGVPIHYDPVGEDGQPPPEGRYRYLLRLTSHEWRGARTQSGTFFVEGGRLVGRSSTAVPGRRPPSAKVQHRVSPLRSGTVGISSSLGVTPAASVANDAVLVYDASNDGITFMSMESIYSSSSGTYPLGWQTLANSYGFTQLAWIDPTLTYGYTSIITSPFGEVGIGTIPTPYTYLEVYGDAHIDGDVTMGSSRALKTGFEPVEAGKILDGLMTLPLQKWRFRRDSREAVHLGPFSEDFHATFGLGADDEHLSPIDTAGVAFAAIQGLHGEVESLRRQNVRLGWITCLAMLVAVAAPFVTLRLGR